ncbi:MAG: peptidyl-prolyl cis-trans isomerase [Candidatus Kerfeldbacteria bacterium]|nr:peptidyl-prolyl cis-trans isomerase [Candidatus Kerfeldbacteria bacterium]
MIATIRELYGWDPEQFKQFVIRPVVLNDKLQEKLSFDNTLNAAQRSQADTVLELVMKGDQKFEDIAKRYSEDVYSSNGGDLGFVNRGEQAKEIDEAAFTIGLNEPSALIHTKYGFHIIKVLERKTVDGQEQAHILQITIAAPSVDQFLTTKLGEYRVWLFWQQVAWDAKQGRVVSD